MKSWIGFAGLLLIAVICRGEVDTSAAPAPVALAGEATGRVLVREDGDGPYRGRAKPGMELRAGDAVLTGPGARVEWRVGERGRWRVGERAVWIAGAVPGDAGCDHVPSLQDKPVTWNLG